MAGFVVSPNTISVKLGWVIQGNPNSQFNVLHGLYTTAGPLSPNIAQNIFAAIVASAATTTFLAHLSPDILLGGVSVRDLRSANNPEIPSTGGGVAGTGTGNMLPVQNATVITLRTAFIGRSFRGRAFLFGYTTAAVTPTGAIVAQV